MHACIAGRRSRGRAGARSRACTRLFFSLPYKLVNILGVDITLGLTLSACFGRRRVLYPVVGVEVDNCFWKPFAELSLYCGWVLWMGGKAAFVAYGI